MSDAILWAVPKHQTTIEKRRTRKFGKTSEGGYRAKYISRRIRVDHKTGEYFELGKLAPETYKRVMAETERIQKNMANVFGVGSAKDQDVVVLYKGEEEQRVPDDKKVVEMEYERPAFFSKNLLQKPHGVQPTSTTVRPTQLG